MPRCFFSRCKNRHSRQGHKHFTLHVFPRSPEMVEKWLTATGQHFKNIDATVCTILDRRKQNTFRMCSDHFSDDAYETFGVSRHLKLDAVPSIFCSPRSSRQGGVSGIIQPSSREVCMTTEMQGVSSTTVTPSVGILGEASASEAIVRPKKRITFFDHDYTEEATVYSFGKLVTEGTNTDRVKMVNKSCECRLPVGHRSVKTQTRLFLGRRYNNIPTENRLIKKDASTWTGDGHTYVSFDDSSLMECETSIPLKETSISSRKSLFTAVILPISKELPPTTAHEISETQSSVETPRKAMKADSDDTNDEPETKHSMDQSFIDLKFITPPVHDQFQLSYKMAPVNFEDILVCFSEDEWESLEDWQRKLYDEVTKENSELLVSLELLLRRPPGKFFQNLRDEIYTGSAQKSAGYISLKEVKTEQREIKLGVKPELYSVPLEPEEERVLLCNDQKPASKNRMLVERLVHDDDAATPALVQDPLKPGALQPAHRSRLEDQTLCDDRQQEGHRSQEDRWPVDPCGSSSQIDDELNPAQIASEAAQSVEVLHNCNDRQLDDLEAQRAVYNLYKCEATSPSDDFLKKSHSEYEDVHTVQAQYNCEFFSQGDNGLLVQSTNLDSVQIMQDQHKCEPSSPGYGKHEETSLQSCSSRPDYGLSRGADSSPCDAKLQETSAQGVNKLSATSPHKDNALDDPTKPASQQSRQHPCQWEVSSYHIYKLQEAQVKPRAELPEQDQHKSMDLSPCASIIDAARRMPSPYICEASRRTAASPDQQCNTETLVEPLVGTSQMEPSQNHAEISVLAFSKQVSSPGTNKAYHEQCMERKKLQSGSESRILNCRGSPAPVDEVPTITEAESVHLTGTQDGTFGGKRLSLGESASAIRWGFSRHCECLEGLSSFGKESMSDEESHFENPAKPSTECTGKMQDVAVLSDPPVEDTDMSEHPWVMSPGSLVCIVCCETFQDEPSLMIHRRIHARNKPFVCVACGRCYFTKIALEAHELIHNGESPFSCSNCGRVFRAKSNMLVHVRNHTGEKPYACKICPKHFRHKQQVKIRTQTHTGGKRVDCENSFNRKSTIDANQKIHKETLPQTPFTTHQTLPNATPNEQQNRDQQKPFTCGDCGASISLETHLVSHQERHVRKKCRVCSICETRFVPTFDHNKPVVTATKLHPSVCTSCNKSLDGMRLQGPPENQNLTLNVEH